MGGLGKQATAFAVAQLAPVVAGLFLYHKCQDIKCLNVFHHFRNKVVEQEHLHKHTIYLHVVVMGRTYVSDASMLRLRQ